MCKTHSFSQLKIRRERDFLNGYFFSVQPIAWRSHCLGSLFSRCRRNFASTANHHTKKIPNFKTSERFPRAHCEVIKNTRLRSPNIECPVEVKQRVNNFLLKFNHLKLSLRDCLCTAIHDSKMSRIIFLFSQSCAIVIDEEYMA